MNTSQILLYRAYRQELNAIYAARGLPEPSYDDTIKGMRSAGYNAVKAAAVLLDGAPSRTATSNLAYDRGAYASHPESTLNHRQQGI